MSRRIKLIATDLDGTLVRSDGTVSPRTVAALDSAEQAGIHVVYVTGRPPRWMAPVVDVTKRHNTAICSNGAQLYDCATGELIQEFALGQEVALKVASILREHFPDVRFAAERGLEFVSEKDFVPGWEPEDRGRFGSSYRSIDEAIDRPVAKLLARTPDPESSPRPLKLQDAQDLVGHFATVTYSISFGLLEVSAIGVDKASGLRTQAEMLGIEASEVMAFGDMPNDIPMLKWAGHSYAMENAHRLAKEAARFGAESNDNDGVAKEIETLLGL